MDHEGDHTPDLAGVSFGHMDVGIVRALGLQADALAVFDQPFHSQLIVDHRDHHLAADRFKGSIDHQNVVVVDTGTDHGVACHPDKKCGSWVGHHKFIEVKPAFDVVVCWARESCGDATSKERAFEFALAVEDVDCRDGWCRGGDHGPQYTG